MLVAKLLVAPPVSHRECGCGSEDDFWRTIRRGQIAFDVAERFDTLLEEQSTRVARVKVDLGS